jgi:DNA polymerase-3 subunit delta
MKLGARDIRSFLAAPPAALRGLLIYGADEGQARLYMQQFLTRQLGEHYDPLNRIDLSGDQLKEDPARLADELNALSLMGGERIVCLRDLATGQAALVKEALLAEPAPVAKLVVLAGELKPSSALRQMFEKEKSLAALACYKDDDRQLSTLVQEKFRELNIQAEQGIIPAMLRLLGNDRAITLSEIEKIDLYLGDERQLTMQALERLMADNSELTLDDLCQAVAGGQPQHIPALLHKLNQSGTQPIGVLRILHNHFQKLQQIQRRISGGLTIDDALKQMRIFYKQQAAFRQQLQRWNGQALTRAMEALLQGERDIKRHPSTAAEAICAELLQRLSLHALRQR